MSTGTKLVDDKKATPVAEKGSRTGDLGAETGVARALEPGTRAIPGIYARWTLDCVVEAATVIAHDYRTRYRQYRDVDPDTIGVVLANIKSRVGFDPEWPNKDQRTAINTPLIGPSEAEAAADSTAPFCEVAKAVRAAAIAYSERVFDTGEPMLRQAFIDACRHFHAYLTTLGGSVVTRAYKDTQPLFQKSADVLGVEEVANAFGLPPAPTKSWPIPDVGDRSNGYLDGDGAYLVEEVARVLQKGKGITQQQFLSLQRAAAAGARTIHFVLEDHHERNKKDDPDLSSLIGDAYSWATALRDWEASHPEAESKRS